MSRSASPLRYPGGKACLLEITQHIISWNKMEQRHYAEPYSGGCGLALSLLFSGQVSHVHLNDADRSIWAFWHAVLNDVERFVRLVETTAITVAEWDRQREVQSNKSLADPLELGFSTFFLNRTNRSGIIHSGGIIGGRDQGGAWTIDCRFNKEDLIRRIRRVNLYRGKIRLYNEDAEVFLHRAGDCYPLSSLLYIDPPYYEKGSSLYRNYYYKRDHARLKALFSALPVAWFLTYDNVQPIRELYSTFQSIELDIGYSAQTKRRGTELLVFSPHLKMPPDLRAEARAA